MGENNFHSPTVPKICIFFRDFLDRQTFERSSSTNNSNKNSNKNNNNRTETAAAAATSTTKRSRFRERITKSNKRASFLPYESVVNDLEDGGDENPGDGEADEPLPPELVRQRAREEDVEDGGPGGQHAVGDGEVVGVDLRKEGIDKKTCKEKFFLMYLDLVLDRVVGLVAQVVADGRVVPLDHVARLELRHHQLNHRNICSI